MLVLLREQDLREAVPPGREDGHTPQIIRVCRASGQKRGEADKEEELQEEEEMRRLREWRSRRRKGGGREGGGGKKRGRERRRRGLRRAVPIPEKRVEQG